MYCARFGCLLRGKWGFFEQKKTKAAKHPSRSRTQKTVFVFFVAFCQSRLAKSLRRDPKTNPPADFSPAGGNLFNVSSVGLDRDPEGRPDQTADRPLLQLGVLARVVIKFNLAATLFARNFQLMRDPGNPIDRIEHELVRADADAIVVEIQDLIFVCATPNAHCAWCVDAQPAVRLSDVNYGRWVKPQKALYV
jgi:hypothetical protein